VSNQDTQIDSLGIEGLTEVRKAAKTVFDSGVLTPHEKQHLWDVCMRIDGKAKELGEQEGSLR
jgi:hypothetical protein